MTEGCYERYESIPKSYRGLMGAINKVVRVCKCIKVFMCVCDYVCV